MSEYRRALAVLDGQCPLAARALVLRYVSEWSECEVAAACELSVRVLDGHLRLARTRFAALYWRLGKEVRA
jgi:DNA-directed RNA polymerase specialized sigma24 family protein